MRLKFTPLAEKDLGRIVKYIARVSDRTTAWRYGLKIQQTCLKICSAPGMGKRHPIYPKIRKVNMGSHKIFYREEPGRIVIHRIWDGRRGSQPNLLFSK